MPNCLARELPHIYVSISVAEVVVQQWKGHDKVWLGRSSILTDDSPLYINSKY